MAYEAAESDIMKRRPRDAKKDKLVNDRYIKCGNFLRIFCHVGDKHEMESISLNNQINDRDLIRTVFLKSRLRNVSLWENCVPG